MNREPQIEDSEQYWEKIRKLEIEMFPEFREEDIHAPNEDHHLWFAPSWHFRSGLLTAADIQDFTSDNSKKLLSIGSGPAFLERLLIKLGIKQENVTLSDATLEHLPQDFKSKTIDMYGEWADLGDEQYDLIIFPESVLITAKFNNDMQREISLYHLISQSLQHLTPNGKIRINGHCLDDQNIEAVKQRFETEGHKIEMTYTKNLIEVENQTVIQE